MTRSSAPLDDYAKRLMAGLQTIPVEELIHCARENLKATRRVRMSKDDPAGEEEPDFSTRQKALQFITEQTAGAAATRKPVEAAPPTSDQRPNPGLLRKKGSEVSAGG